MPEADPNVKTSHSDAIRILQVIRGFFSSDDDADPVARLENCQYRAALDLAIEALKAAGK